MIRSLNRVAHSRFRPNPASSFFNTPQRNFSIQKEASADDIFQSADYFSDNVAKTAQNVIEQSHEVQLLPWQDMNDTLSTFSSLLPKDIHNIPIGQPTYGFWEYIAYLDQIFYDLWIVCAEPSGLGLGLGGGLILSSFITKAAFAPVLTYSQIVGVKMRLLQPDNDELMASMRRYQQQGDKESAKMERAKLKYMRKVHGIYPLISMVNLFQVPVHMVYISMINRLSFNYETNPAILTEGFWWFKDLSSPDPTGILPILGGVVTLLSMLTNPNGSASPTMMKLRKYLYLMPLITVPVWMTFPVAFNLYWLTVQMVQLAIVTMFRFHAMRRLVGIPEYLPGTKLERLNSKLVKVSTEDQPIVLSRKPDVGARKKAIASAEKKQ